MTHRVETWWTTTTWTAVCLDCPWQIDGDHTHVTEAAHTHAQRPREARTA